MVMIQPSDDFKTVHPLSYLVVLLHFLPKYWYREISGFPDSINPYLMTPV